ncbi:hypothetical protein [Chryseobacterium shandongense]|uniref:hypothetical protein n=1 Tax=Chryseobacterium shandongense TaxID=1493872 RepID=UPI000F4F8615|nr:hypothetical protein [Chryseobacterium shandongense]AZA56351.1 hypothetical protein EG350_03720 [Chryseobacterium shandongense]
MRPDLEYLPEHSKINHITFISTTHKENGRCKANELCSIIEQLAPDVIFLEALKDTYSEYEQYLFSEYQVFHKKLEIEALQQYCYKSSFEYVPVLDDGMSEVFDKKYEIATQNVELQRKIESFNTLSAKYGFQFLNSDLSMRLQQDMRTLEKEVLYDDRLNRDAIEAIDTYENSMLENIFSYCKTNHFSKAIFMCGVAHRKSISYKMTVMNLGREIELNWKVLKF